MKKGNNWPKKKMETLKICVYTTYQPILICNLIFFGYPCMNVKIVQSGLLYPTYLIYLQNNFHAFDREVSH